jgi:hypothetical protein
MMTLTLMRLKGEEEGQELLNLPDLVPRLHDDLACMQQLQSAHLLC